MIGMTRLAALYWRAAAGARPGRRRAAWAGVEYEFIDVERLRRPRPGPRSAAGGEPAGARADARPAGRRGAERKRRHRPPPGRAAPRGGSGAAAGRQPAAPGLPQSPDLVRLRALSDLHLPRLSRALGARRRRRNWSSGSTPSANRCGGSSRTRSARALGARERYRRRSIFTSRSCPTGGRAANGWRSIARSLHAIALRAEALPALAPVMARQLPRDLTALARLGLCRGGARRPFFAAMLLLPPPQGMPVEAWRGDRAGDADGDLVDDARRCRSPPPRCSRFSAFPLMGIMSANDTAAAYYSPILFLVLGGAIIALAIERTGLHRRLALAIVSRGGGDAGSAAARLHGRDRDPQPDRLQHRDHPDHDADRGRGAERAAKRRARASTDGFPGALAMGIAFAASIGGLGTLVGSPTNAIAAGIVERSTGLQDRFPDLADLRHAARPGRRSRSAG